MSIIITEEDLCKKYAKKLQKMANFQVYPTNLANPGRMGTITMTLNIMLVLRIITHAQGFESIEIFWGESDLAAP